MTRRHVALALALACLAGVLFLQGCDISAAWDRAPSTHECTEQEMARVEKESAWCIANTESYPRYCYGTAILRVCKPRNQ